MKNPLAAISQALLQKLEEHSDIDAIEIRESGYIVTMTNGKYTDHDFSDLEKMANQAIKCLRLTTNGFKNSTYRTIIQTRNDLTVIASVNFSIDEPAHFQAKRIWTKDLGVRGDQRIELVMRNPDGVKILTAHTVMALKNLEGLMKDFGAKKMSSDITRALNHYLRNETGGVDRRQIPDDSHIQIKHYRDSTYDAIVHLSDEAIDIIGFK